MTKQMFGQRPWARALLPAVLAVGIAGGAVAERQDLVIDRFSGAVAENGLPGGWEPLTFRKIPQHTVYTISKDGDNFILKAESRSSASGLIKRVEIDPKAHPILTWRWKVENIIRSGDEARKDRDDYAARLYITFKYDPKTAGFRERILFGAYRALYGEYPPQAVLNYIWANKLPKGQSTASLYTDRSRMIALESGEEGVGQWRSESRNVLEDYRAFFGGEPPPIEGIALMTDTDNTGESATAYYDDLVFGSLVR